MKKVGLLSVLYHYTDRTLKKSSYGSQTTDYIYNFANLLAEVNNANGSTQISKYSYTYYVDGNQKSKTESVAGTSKGTTSYTYDGLNRLIKEQAPNNTYSYQYDKYGNRSQLSVTGDENYTTSYTYDKNNRMRNQTKTAGSAKEITDFWYDPNGNQISSMTISTGGTGTAGIGIELAGGNTNSINEYNSWNQLTKTMQNGKTASYTYNGDGLRMSKTVDGIKTSHIWDGTNIVGDVTNGTVTKYIRGLQLISSKQGSNECFYTYNGHGDVVQLTSGTGAITKQYSYDAFGVETDKTDNDTNPFRYCGEYYDEELGYTYLRNRYYDNNTGRFISEDPVRDGGNWYSYCAGEPLMHVDPSGAYRAAGYNKNGVWSDNPDADDYGVDSVVYKALGYLGDAWEHFEYFRKQIEEVANEVRYLANKSKSHVIDNTIKGLRKINMMPENLNYVEQVLVVGYPAAAETMNIARDKADEATWEIFGEAGNGDGEANAFKHAYWNARASKVLGEKMTRIFANAHEFGWVWENVNNPIPMEMDLHNNMVGREVGTSSLEQKNIESAILRRLLNGRLWKIVDGELVETNANASFSK